MTEGEVKNMLLDPVYAGLGPAPAIIPLDQWKEAQVKLINELGPEEYVGRLVVRLQALKGMWQVALGEAEFVEGIAVDGVNRNQA